MRAADAIARLRALPERRFEDVFGDAPILILAPHEDDESLGCGGVIAEATSRGQPVQIAFVTDGGMSHPDSVNWPRLRRVAQRHKEALSAARILGVDAAQVTFLDAPDSEVPHDGPAFDRLVERVRHLAAAHASGTICASWRGDPHGDHGATAKIADAVAASNGWRHISYPIWGWTLAADAWAPEIADGARIHVGRHLERKREAIVAHQTQYSGLIDDSPNGFQLSSDFIRLFLVQFETFVKET